MTKASGPPLSQNTGLFPTMAFQRGMRRVHFVGIGGSGMSGIAEVLSAMGFEVSGSDTRSTPVTERLARLGCQVFEGHSAGNVQDADVVVVSSAVPASNPEVFHAKTRHIPVIPRAEMLGELMRMKFSVGVAGAHGKTTTTSMIAMILQRAGLDPTVIIGGRLSHFDANARLGSGTILVAEADESDGSFLKLFPAVAVVTNLDAEHLNYYGCMECIHLAFLDYVNRVPFYGTAILCLDDPYLRAMLPEIGRRVVTYGFCEDACFRASNLQADGVRMSFVVARKGAPLGRFELSIPGRHNVLNALAAIAVAVEFSAPLEVIGETLAQFHGADRRFQLRGEVGGVRVVDDYGHHPTEIKATLDAARGVTGGRVIAIFQPHRYSRVRDLWAEFSGAFEQADMVHCLPVYPAGEQPIPGVDGETLAVAVAAASGTPCVFQADFAALAEIIAADARPGDLVITFGAGNVSQVCALVLAALPGEGERL